MRGRSAFVVFGIVLVAVWGTSPAMAAPDRASAAATVTVTAPLTVVSSAATCSELTDPALCDSDRDGITDVVEQIVCGSATCATGREDTDRDGIPDWSEVIVCGSPTCADPRIDTDGDGIPDFAEVYVCGSEVCSTGREDADADGITDWVEFVICGNRSCANGREDYDGDGVSDAQQLAACVIAFDVTGPGVQPAGEWSGPIPAGSVTVESRFIWWPLIVGALLFVAGLLALGAALWALRRRDREQAEEESGGDGDAGGDASAQLAGLLDAPK